jgi:hypothetical protein
LNPRVQADIQQPRNEQMVAQVRKKIRADHCLTMREIAEEVNYSDSCQEIFTEDLAIRHIVAKFLPRLLSDDQKSRRLQVCEKLKRRVEMKPQFISLPQNQNEVKREI